jgi:hypothetical protein
VRFNTQPLPVMTVGHWKLAGPVQPAGSAPVALASDRLDHGEPSLELKLMWGVWLPPTMAATAAFDGLTIIESFFEVCERQLPAYRRWA